MSDNFVKLNNGRFMPLIGLGTGGLDPDTQYNSLMVALRSGYRLIDTAYMYKNEDIVGRAVKDWISSGGKREELFITTKLPQIGNRASDVEKFLKISLKNLQVDYVDLYLIHWPFGFQNMDDSNIMPLNEDGSAKLDKDTDLESLWKGMEKQVDARRAKSIGISNFNPEQVERIMKIARIPPVTNQVEYHIYFQQKELVPVCAKHNIVITAYSPLGSPGAKELIKKINGQPVPWTLPNLMENEVAKQIAKTHGKTSSQILLRFIIQNGIIAIPRSSNPERIKSNLQIFDFSLTSAEMDKLRALDVNTRHIQVTDFMPGCENHPEYPFK